MGDNSEPHYHRHLRRIICRRICIDNSETRKKLYICGVWQIWRLDSLFLSFFQENLNISQYLIFWHIWSVSTSIERRVDPNCSKYFDTLHKYQDSCSIQIGKGRPIRFGLMCQSVDFAGRVCRQTATRSKNPQIGIHRAVHCALRSDWALTPRSKVRRLA